MLDVEITRITGWSSHFVDWCLSLSLLAGAFFALWVCAVLIGEQNHLTGADEDIKQDWAEIREAFKYNWRMFRKHWRR